MSIKLHSLSKCVLDYFTAQGVQPEVEPVEYRIWSYTFNFEDADVVCETAFAWDADADFDDSVIELIADTEHQPNPEVHWTERTTRRQLIHELSAPSKVLKFWDILTEAKTLVHSTKEQ